MLRHLMIVAIAAAAAVATARAEEHAMPLKDAPGRDVVEGNCAACHSLEYIRTNSPFMTAKVWEAEVNKMINAFGAPIAKEDVEPIATYLAEHYGKPAQK